VWDAWSRGELDAIRAYCETDVVNTYLLYLRFLLLRGVLDAPAHAEEVALVKKRLQELPDVPWSEYLKLWDAAASAVEQRGKPRQPSPDLFSGEPPAQ
jgi:hypothetical protein